MHLKVMRQMTVIPRSVGAPPLSDANFEQVLMTNAMMVQQQQQQRHSATAVAGLLVSGDTVSTTNIPFSQQQQQQQPSQISFTSLLTMGEDDGKVNNPLAGMGLSDEHYNMILQNLVNGERFMGMGMDGVQVGGKRTIDDVEFGSNERGGKRSRFEVIE
jgi:osomolarity two-component system, response regulator SKN7